MIIRADQFFSKEQYQEHRKILKLGCRCFDCFYVPDLWISYRGREHTFYVRYHQEGGSFIFIQYNRDETVHCIEEMIKDKE